MALRIDIKRKGLVPGVTPRQAQEIKRDTLKRIAGLWHYRFRPKHFTAAGARAYKMQRRKTKNIYAGTIKRGRGAQSGRPLVKSGETERKARIRTIRGTFRKSTVSMPIGHINRYKPVGFAPGQLRYEATLVLKREEQELGKDAEKFIRQRFSKRKTNISVTQFSRG